MREILVGDEVIRGRRKALIKEGNTVRWITLTEQELQSLTKDPDTQIVEKEREIISIDMAIHQKDSTMILKSWYFSHFSDLKNLLERKGFMETERFMGLGPYVVIERGSDIHVLCDNGELVPWKYMLFSLATGLEKVYRAIKVMKEEENE